MRKWWRGATAASSCTRRRSTRTRSAARAAAPPAYVCRRMAHFRGPGLAAWPSVSSGRCSMRSSTPYIGASTASGPRCPRSSWSRTIYGGPSCASSTRAARWATAPTRRSTTSSSARRRRRVRKRLSRSSTTPPRGRGAAPRADGGLGRRADARGFPRCRRARFDALTTTTSRRSLRVAKFRKRIDKKRTIARGAPLCHVVFYMSGRSRAYAARGLVFT